MSRYQRGWAPVWVMAAVFGGAGCEEAAKSGEGSLTVLLEPESTITAGLEPGPGVAQIRDGWAARFDRYVVAVGEIDLHWATDDAVQAQAEPAYAVDLTQLPPAGLALWSLEGLRAGRWAVHFATVPASEAVRHESVEVADDERMVAQGWSHWITGSLTQVGGQSCPPKALAQPGERVAVGQNTGGDDCYEAQTVRFEFGVSAPTRSGPCEIDGSPGVAVVAGGVQTVALSMHGDHLFFNGFPEGGEGGVTRLAQWLADCDLDLDGVVTQAELRAIAPSQLSQIDTRYQLGGSPITPLETMYDYVASQLKTQGHFQGEGECPIDGVAHDHEHSHAH